MSILDVVGQFIGQIMQLNVIVLFFILFVGIIVAYKVMGYLLRIFITGAIFACFPIAANFLGLPVPITLQSIIWSAIFGVIMFFAYSLLKAGFKIIKIVFSPFKGLFKEKPKEKVVYVKEVKKDEKKEKESA